ncbi:MAG: aminotransferase class III-fold pyridoxal phosphate-dependent enzyme [Spirochaetes bacterium]|nr:aminotransferase class III-fold pyridoxal phosphate-dependent enzyme [Spirochaetota bacterium]
MKEAPKLNLKKSFEEFERGKKLVPGGVLGIRRPYNFVEGEYPIYFDHGKGGRVYDIDGNEYIDYLAAYGPIIIGYREEEIDEAVIKQIRDKGFCFSLTQKVQNDLAEKLISLIPSAQKCIFVKTGSDATTLAIRLARAYTGKIKIARCGYHGWHDWCVEVKGGIPQKLYEDVLEFEYNDFNMVEKIVNENKNDLAAIIITPVGHPLAKPVEEPKDNFLQKLRKITEENGIVLIFDEIRSGFRVSIGGAQQYYGVIPDLSVFGKAMANGYAISVTCGKKEIMDKAEKEVFVSSTFFPNSLSYIAALKTIEIIQRDKIIETVWEKGKKLLDGLKKVIDSIPETQAHLSGIPPMPYITFNKDEKGLYKLKRTDFFTQLIRRHVFMQPYHHGYVIARHTYEDIEYTINAVKESLEYVSEKKY